MAAGWCGYESVRAACAHTPRLSPSLDLIYLAIAAIVFAGCLAVQYVGYDRILGTGLARPEADVRRRAIKRWLYFALAWQSLVIAGILVYAFVMTHGHRPDLAWVAPAVAALIGTALPYQLAAMRLVRAAASG